MAGTKLKDLPHIQITRLNDISKTTERIDSITKSYYRNGYISVTSYNATLFDIADARKKIKALEKIFHRIEKNFDIG